MLTNSYSDTEEVIDKRILREEYRTYDLVARYWDFGYLGKIWKNRKAVEEIDANDEQGLDDLIVLMRQYVDETIESKTVARKNKAPSQAELNDAFKSLNNNFTALEKLALKNLAEQGGPVDVATFQKLLNLTSAESLLEILNRIGQKLNDEIGYQPKVAKNENPALKLLLSSQKDMSVLTMPEAVQLIVLGMAW